MKINYGIVALIMLFWFVISFITNILGPLIPDIINNFELSQLVLAGFIPSSFFVAYAIMSIPAGIMVEKFNEKIVLIVGFSMPLLGALCFALFPSYGILLVSCFVIGMGMAMLQTVINPLTRVAGGVANFAFFSVMGQLVFGLASFISPLVYASLVLDMSEHRTGGSFFIGFLKALVPENMNWVALYWVFAFVLVLVIILIAFVRFPVVRLTDDEKAGSFTAYKTLFKNRFVRLYFLGIFAYVATEQGIANWISKFLEQYHQLSPLAEGAQTVGRFWGFMSVGCLLGLVMLKLFDAKKVLLVSSVGAMVALVASVFGNAEVALVGFPLIGFCISVMFSIIMSLGMNSISSHHGAMAGILCSGIVGGAVGPLLMGWLGDVIGLRMAMLGGLVTLGYILSIAFWANPLVNNSTVRFSELFKGR
ncbi:MAG: MFS transporter [Breznakibacter sp.]|nr:MFS transporter [Breznakibacter sp.]